MLFVCALFLSGFLLAAALKTVFTQVDAYVNSWAASIHSSFLTITAEVVSFAFDTNTLLVLSLFTAICLFYKRFLAEGVLLLSAMGANALCVETAKILVHSSTAKRLSAGDWLFLSKWSCISNRCLSWFARMLCLAAFKECSGEKRFECCFCCCGCLSRLRQSILKRALAERCYRWIYARSILGNLLNTCHTTSKSMWEKP